MGNRRSVLLVLSLGWLCAVAAQGQDYREVTDFFRLKDKLGAATPLGTNIQATQVEAYEPGFQYLPNTNHFELQVVDFHPRSGVTNPSSHATDVARYLCGTSRSMSAEVRFVDNYYSGHWLGSGFLNPGPTSAPKVETNEVQTHAYISNDTNTNLNMRMDYAINRDGFLASVGLKNGTNKTLPALWGHSYNAISVGVSDGDHSSGTTFFDGSGRVKPEIVAPRTETSWAVPIIASAGAVFLSHINSDSNLAQAAETEVIKAILMAGAEKDKLTEWDRTHSRPLDNRFGAGEINMYNSYFLLDAGEQPHSTNSTVQNMGWDYATIQTGMVNQYVFDVPTNQVLTRFSAILTWNRKVWDSNPGLTFAPKAALPDLDLHFYTATNFSTNALIDWSTSRVDNVEHIYAKHLNPGRYLLQVSADTNTDYGIAWYSRSSVIPAISEESYTTNKTFTFRFSATEEIPYTVLTATNLLQTNAWSVLTTNLPATNFVIVTDAAVSNINRLYYRIVPEPK